MKQADKRKIALGAVRSEFRRQGRQPQFQLATSALAVLDDLLRSEPDLIASQWYDKASEAQIKLFSKEWNAWKATFLLIQTQHITDGDYRVWKE
jgi:hypothetical protein